ncbi:hypothetical protein FCM35_KLT07479 [Carex littledalei]|uniref:Uncharacterized protein n=1 Tax=Carex littledalei TaxID=544730 RepID=A0A833QSM8_9POAL|nr:hypothetical protein FCM35_KLT07479 [Carex littledalei]
MQEVGKRWRFLERGEREAATNSDGGEGFGDEGGSDEERGENRYKQATFCYEELILVNPSLYQISYADGFSFFWWLMSFAYMYVAMCPSFVIGKEMIQLYEIMLKAPGVYGARFSGLGSGDAVLHLWLPIMLTRQQSLSELSTKRNNLS